MTELDRYLKELGQLLDCPAPLRRRLLKKIRRIARDFSSAKPNATFPEVATFLGAPGELAQTLLESTDQEELKRYRRHKKCVWICIILLLLMGLLCAAVAMKQALTNTYVVDLTKESVLVVEEKEMEE